MLKTKPAKKGKMKRIAHKLLNFTFHIPLSVVLVMATSIAIGVGFHSLELGAGVAVFSSWTSIPLLATGPFCDAARYIGSYKPITMNGEFTADAFAGMIKALRDQVNAMRAGLPPLEQFETASDLSFGLRSLQNSAANLLDMAEGLADLVTQYSQELTTTAEQSAEADLIAKGEYIKKTDSEAAVKAAAEAKEKEVKDALQAETKVKERVVAARAKLVEDKVCTEAVAARLPDDFFKEEGYTDRVAKITARLKVLADNKINHSEEFVTEMAAIPLDAAGDQVFDNRVKAVKGLVATSASSRTETSARASLAMPAGDDGAPALVF